MSYSGRVHPGGRPDVRELPRLVVTKLSVSEMDNNVYLLRCRQTDTQVLVDAADDAARVLEVVGADGLERVVTTHKHWDHHRALAEVVRATGAETVAGAEDADELPVPVDRRVVGGDVVEVGDCRLEVIHLVGHTPGSSRCCTTTPTARRTCSPGTPCSRGVSARPGRRRTSRPSSTRCPRSCSTGCPTRPGSTPATVTTPRSGPSVPHVDEWRARGW